MRGQGSKIGRLMSDKKIKEIMAMKTWFVSYKLWNC